MKIFTMWFVSRISQTQHYTDNYYRGAAFTAKPCQVTGQMNTVYNVTISETQSLHVRFVLCIVVIDNIRKISFYLISVKT
jgi:hypothetical protein